MRAAQNVYARHLAIVNSADVLAPALIGRQGIRRPRPCDVRSVPPLSRPRAPQPRLLAWWPTEQFALTPITDEELQAILHRRH